MTRLNLLSVGSPTVLRARASSRQPGLSRLLQTARLVISLRVSSKRDWFSFFARSVRFLLGEKLNSKFKFNYLFLLETSESMPRSDDLGWEQVDQEGVQRSPASRPRGRPTLTCLAPSTNRFELGGRTRGRDCACLS